MQVFSFYQHFYLLLVNLKFRINLKQRKIYLINMIWNKADTIDNKQNIEPLSVSQEEIKIFQTDEAKRELFNQVFSKSKC